MVNSTTTPITGTPSGAFPDGVLPPTPVNLTGAKTLGTEHNGAAITLDAAAGQAITLPAATGSGNAFRLFVKTTITSNSTTIKVANGDDVLTGVALNAADGGNTVVAFETAATSDTITLDGSTTGGIKGDQIELIDIAENLWAVKIVGSATGTEATPFSATVS